MSRLFGALSPDGTERFFWLLFDPTLRLLNLWPIEAGETVIRALPDLPPAAEHAGRPMGAPVMVAPRIFGPGLCRTLIEMHETSQSQFSGVMRDSGDVTVAVMDELSAVTTRPTAGSSTRTRTTSPSRPRIGSSRARSTSTTTSRAVICASRNSHPRLTGLRWAER